MTMLDPSNANHRHYRCLRKKRKMKKKNHVQAICDTQKPSTKSTLLTILCLIGVFAILAYFRSH